MSMSIICSETVLLSVTEFIGCAADRTKPSFIYYATSRLLLILPIRTTFKSSSLLSVYQILLSRLVPLLSDSTQSIYSSDAHFKPDSARYIIQYLVFLKIQYFVLLVSVIIYCILACHFNVLVSLHFYAANPRIYISCHFPHSSFNDTTYHTQCLLRRHKMAFLQSPNLWENQSTSC